MAVYILIAISTTVMAAIVDRINNRVAKVMLMAAMVLVFCYFAGARDLTVGTDTGGYAYSTFCGAKAYPIAVFLSNRVYSGWGFLYKFIAWISTYIFGTFGAMLFAIELCIVVPVVFVGYKYTNRHLALVTILFSLYFYPLSFNLIRQSIAMSYVLVAWWGLDRKKIIWYFVWLTVAFFFHSSAVLGLLILAIDAIAKSNSLPFSTRALLFGIFSLIGLLFLPYALNVIAPYLPHYSAYITESESAIRGRGYRNIIEVVIAFSTLYLLYKVFILRGVTDNNSDILKRVNELFLIVFFGVIVTGISPFSVYLGRVGMYFLYFALLLIPTALELIPGNTERSFFAIVSVGVVALLALDLFVITGQNEVIPYVFATL